MMTYENQNLMTSVDDTMTLLMADEVAALLMVGKNRVYELLNENKLKGMKIGKKSWRIPKSAVYEYIRMASRLS